MRVLARVLLLVGASISASVSAPSFALACTGPSIEFADALRASRGAIYAGRITHVNRSEIGTSKVMIDVDIVVRGRAGRALPDVLAPFACDLIREGRWGYIVRDVRDADYVDGSADVFFSIGTSVARPALRAAGLPDTAATVAGPAPSARNDTPFPWLVIAGAGYVVVYRLLGGRAIRARPGGGMAPSTALPLRSRS